MSQTVEVKERPILFSAPMVKAILDGRKTQTRRIVKLRDPSGTYSTHDDDGWPCSADECGDWHRDRSKFGKVGERLWVRESGYRPPKTVTAKMLREGADTWPEFVYTATTDSHECEWFREHGWRSTPSIFMPRWASRITLEITDVRAERLNSISEADAKAEGVSPGCLTCGENCIDSGGCGYCCPDYRDSFIHLWSTINGPDSWNQNPFVWVLSFKRLGGES